MLHPCMHSKFLINIENSDSTHGKFFKISMQPAMFFGNFILLPVTSFNSLACLKGSFTGPELNFLYYIMEGYLLIVSSFHYGGIHLGIYLMITAYLLRKGTKNQIGSVYSQNTSQVGLQFQLLSFFSHVLSHNANKSIIFLALA